MVGWVVSRMVHRVAARSRAGDMAPTLALWANDGHFQFPGRSSWAADLHDKAAIGRWYERFARAGLQLEPHVVLVKGWPWNMTVCVHFTDHANDAAGRRVYENHGVILFKMAWGKVRFGTVYEDTQKVAEFDDYLTGHQVA